MKFMRRHVVSRLVRLAVLTVSHSRLLFSAEVSHGPVRVRPERFHPLLIHAAVISTASATAMPLAAVGGNPVQAVAGETASPAPQSKIPKMLAICWSRGPNLPQGLQDNDGGILGQWLITVGGFCSGGLEEDNRRKPGRYPRGFLKKGWELDLSTVKPVWRSLPDFPGEARQGLSAAVVGDAIYFWGGFSYSEPYCYDDGWRLSRHSGRWVWEAVPRFPWRICALSLTVIGTRIYAFGGADYNAEAFFTETDRDGKTNRLGARLMVLDTMNLEAGWQELPACPGTPRWVNAHAAVGGKLYVIGGASGDTKKNGVRYGYCTIVDNWMFDPTAKRWSRIRDLPVSSGNFPRSSSAVYKDRYMVLPGGHQYDHVLCPDGTVREKYGLAARANPRSGLHNDVFVYDTAADLFGFADPLPIDNNLPMTVVHGDEIFLLGGETGGGIVENEYYGHHPELFLRGKIAEVPLAGRKEPQD